MKLLRMLALGAALGIATKTAASQLQRATLNQARLLSIQPGQWPTAQIALDYSAGPRPQTIIVDISCPEGSGSATVSGDTNVVDIALIADTVTDTIRIQATSLDRRLGTIDERSYSF